jgi:hypothetical protein
LALAAEVVGVVVVMQSFGAGTRFDNIGCVRVDDSVSYRIVGVMFLWVNSALNRGEPHVLGHALDRVVTSC